MVVIIPILLPLYLYWFTLVECIVIVNYATVYAWVPCQHSKTVHTSISHSSCFSKSTEYYIYFVIICIQQLFIVWLTRQTAITYVVMNHYVMLDIIVMMMKMSLWAYNRYLVRFCGGLWKRMECKWNTSSLFELCAVTLVQTFHVFYNVYAICWWHCACRRSLTKTKHLFLILEVHSFSPITINDVCMAWPRISMCNNHEFCSITRTLKKSRKITCYIVGLAVYNELLGDVTAFPSLRSFKTRLIRWLFKEMVFDFNEFTGFQTCNLNWIICLIQLMVSILLMI